MSTWRPFQTDHASLAIVDVPLAPGKLRYATAGAPGDDDDLIRDEDYISPPPSPTPGSRPGISNTGQHGSGRNSFKICESLPGLLLDAAFNDLHCGRAQRLRARWTSKQM
ncbi:hypothetical protein F4604DRAFT_1900559 [Suillus subluteus]|nr:hypothetical protein F4604DRAFT_1900559 [Suillus subluteus]